MNIDDFNQLARDLEAGASAGGDGIEPFAISAAISLKRIADSLANIEAVTCNPRVTISDHPQA